MSHYVHLSSPPPSEKAPPLTPRKTKLTSAPMVMDPTVDKEKGPPEPEITTFGGYLKGPILFQLGVMYTFFIVIVGSAELLAWAPNIRIANFVPYVIICLILVQATRLCKFRPSIQFIFPFYTAIIPYIYLCIFSREAHILVSLLYVCASMCIFLQSGIPYLQFHVVTYISLFVASNAASVGFMAWFYTDDTGLKSFRGRKLDPGVSWGQEATFWVSIVLLGLAFLMLEKFVKLYANSLLERSHQIKTLQKEKDELVEEIKKFKGDSAKDVDLDAPIQKVIQVLQSMANELNQSSKEQLANVIKILASNKLYSPDLESGTGVDGELSSWLSNMLANGERKEANKFSIGQVAGKEHGYKVSPLFAPILDKGAEAQVEALLERIEEWDFNIFEIAELTNGHPLFFISSALFNKHDLLHKFNIDEMKFKRFITIMESGYDNKQPYHNSTHASDVLQTLNYFITKGGLSQYVTELDILSALIAAIIHDYEHPGLNNAYHINTQSDLAIRYNDKSVLENYHCATAFRLIYEDQNNIFTGLNEAQKKEVRESVVSMVLATDMAQHFDLLGKFKSKLAGNGFDPKDRKDRLLLLQIAIKCADISNPAKSTYLCNTWAARVMEEFFRQGDEERRQSLPISAFMDRTKPAEAKCQLGFIDFIVGPLYEVWVNFLPQMTNLLVLVEQNRAMWKKRNLPTEQLVYDTPPSKPTENNVQPAPINAPSDKT